MQNQGHMYYNEIAYQQAMLKARTAANTLNAKLVFGYCSYAGWTHVEASDVFAVASLGDAVLVEPGPVAPHQNQ
jgi:hypothetical protein